MPRLYLDHNVSVHLAPSLSLAGHDVLTARGLGLTRLSDDAQLLTAARNGRALVTHNRRDFTLLHDAWTTWPAAFGAALPAHAGILVLDAAPLEELSSAIVGVLSSTPAAELANGLFWWRRRDGWRRRVAGTRWDSHPPPAVPGSSQ